MNKEDLLKIIDEIFVNGLGPHFNERHAIALDTVIELIDHPSLLTDLDVSNAYDQIIVFHKLGAFDDVAD